MALRHSLGEQANKEKAAKAEAFAALTYSFEIQRLENWGARRAALRPY